MPNITPIGAMNTAQRFTDYCEGNREIWFELIRIYLGIALFARGLYIFFPGGREVLHGFLESMGGGGWFAAVFWGHFVIMAHLCGGLFLAVGLLTRLAALVQIPILVGAVLFVHWQDGLFAMGQSLELAALVLFLLIVVFFHGPGIWSLDHYLIHRTMGVPEVPPRRFHAPGSGT